MFKHFCIDYIYISVISYSISNQNRGQRIKEPSRLLNQFYHIFPFAIETLAYFSRTVMFFLTVSFLIVQVVKPTRQPESSSGLSPTFTLQDCRDSSRVSCLLTLVESKITKSMIVVSLHRAIPNDLSDPWSYPVPKLIVCSWPTFAKVYDRLNLKGCRSEIQI